MNSSLKICRLCLQTICGNDFDAIDEYAERMLDKLLLTIDMNVIEEPLICKKCVVNLDKSVNFKSTCLDTVSLSKVKSEKNRDHKSCRFCMKDSKIDDCTYFNETKDKIFIAHVIQKHIPELKLNFAQEVVICTSCLDALQILSSFIKKCLDVEDEIKKYAESSNVPGQINLYDIQQVIYKSIIKCEDGCSYENSSEGLDSNGGDVDLKTEIKNEEYNVVSKPDLTIEDEVIDIKLEQKELERVSCDEYVKEEKYIDEPSYMSEKIPTNEDVEEGDDQQCIEESLNLKSLQKNTSGRVFCDDEDVKERKCTNEPAYISENIPMNEDVEEGDDQQCIEESLNSKSLQKNTSERVFSDDEDVEGQKCINESPYISENIPMNEDVEEDDEQFVDESKFTIEGKGINQVNVLKTKQSYCQDREKELEVEQRNFNSLKEEGTLLQAETDINLIKMEECSLKQPHKTLQVLLVRCDTRIISKPFNSESVRKNTAGRKVHQCKSCSFQTKYKSCLSRHKLNHRCHSQTYRCKYCPYQTDIKDTLKSHLLTHENTSKITTFRCKHCPFLTENRNSLAKHNLIHGSKLHCCKHCSYTTHCRGYLQNHLLIHKDPSEITMYSCEYCSFKTKRNGNLKKHLMTHKNPSEITMYQCEHCSFVTKRKETLNNHLLIHKDPSEINMFRCEHCSFQTKHKGALKMHLLRRIDTYQCKYCAFQTIYKCHWKSHFLTHIIT